MVRAAGKVRRIHEHRIPSPEDGWASVRTVKVHDAIAAEIGAALHQSRATVARRVEQARDLAGAMRPLRDAMQAGHLSPGHAFAVREELLRLPVTDPDPAVHEQHCARVLADVIPYAEQHTPAQARKRTRALVAQIEPINSDDRRQHAARNHGVWVTDEGDDTTVGADATTAGTRPWLWGNGRRLSPRFLKCQRPTGHRRYTHRVGPSARRAG